MLVRWVVTVRDPARLECKEVVELVSDFLGEAMAPDDRARGVRVHGLQTWVALPRAQEFTEPSFTHVARDRLPSYAQDGVLLSIVAGHAFGLRRTKFPASRWPELVETWLGTIGVIPE